MKIIKEGRDPRCGYTVISVCHNCKTEFEWNTNEAVLVPDQRDGDYYKLSCPLCSVQITTDAKLAHRWLPT